MLSSFFQPCEVKIHLLQNAIFIHPPDRASSPRNSEETPPSANDELIRGLVELWVPSDRHIGGIKVKLKGIQTIAIIDSATGTTPISWEETTVLEKTLEIGMHSHKGKGKLRSKSRASSPARDPAQPPLSPPIRSTSSQPPLPSSSAISRQNSLHDATTTHNGTLTPPHEVTSRAASPRPPLSSRGSAASGSGLGLQQQQQHEGNSLPGSPLLRPITTSSSQQQQQQRAHFEDGSASGTETPSGRGRSARRESYQQSGGLAGAIAAAMARGRSSSKKPTSNSASASASASANLSPSTSRATSRANSRSRPGSRIQSRAGSRATSPVRESGALPPTPTTGSSNSSAAAAAAPTMDGARSPRSGSPVASYRNGSSAHPGPEEVAHTSPATSFTQNGSAATHPPASAATPAAVRPTGRGGFGSSGPSSSSSSAQQPVVTTVDSLAESTRSIALGRPSFETPVPGLPFAAGRGGFGNIQRPSMDEGARAPADGRNGYADAGAGSSGGNSSVRTSSLMRGRGGFASASSASSSSASNANVGSSGSSQSRSASVALPLFGSRKDRGVSRGRAREAEDGNGNGNGAQEQRSDSVASVWNGGDADGLHLAKGVHGFEFAFIIPADSPPYERSPFGRVRYVIKATAIGAGRAKSNAETYRDIFPVVIPAPDQGLTPMTVLYNDIHPTVGLLSIACTSGSISVGGIFNVDIHSSSPPVDLIVYLVRITLETNILLRTKRKGKQNVPTQRNKLWERGYVPPRSADSISPGDGNKAHGYIRDAGTDTAWTVQTVARVPDDNAIRASTMPGSRADIRFSHTLVVEVVHSRDPSLEGLPEGSERKLKVFALRQQVVIPSCCVAYQAVMLPEYSEHDSVQRSAAMPFDIGITHIGQPGAPCTLPPAAPWANTSIPQHGTRHDYCVCGMSISDLTERERGMIPQGPGYDVPVDQVRNHGKIGELPPPDDDSDTRSLRRLRRSLSRSGSASRSANRSSSVMRGSSSLNRSMSRGSRMSNNSNSTLHNEGITIIGGPPAADAYETSSINAETASLGAPPSYHSVSEQEEEDEPRGRAPVRVS